MSVNRVVLIGRLTRDPEVRTTQTGREVANFSVAVDRKFNRDETDFFRISAWGKTAEFVGNYLSKGRLVAVDGRLQQREYTDKDGNRREAIEIVADDVQGLDRPRDGDGGGGGGGYSQRSSGGGGGRSKPPVEADDDEHDPFAD